MSADYAPALWVGTPNYAPGRVTPVEYISLHIMVGTLAGTDATFAVPGAMASSTYGVGGDGSVHQYVRESDTAWADGDGVNKSISIEHQGGMDGVPVTAVEVEASARLCADIARRHGWSVLAYGSNVRLHRDIPPYTHPNCPDICPNPLPWRDIVAKANNILKTGSPDIKENEMVEALIQPDDKNCLWYWDGGAIHPLNHPDEATAIINAYRQATGKSIPCFKFGSKAAPWAMRLQAAMSRKS